MLTNPIQYKAWPKDLPNTDMDDNVKDDFITVDCTTDKYIHNDKIMIFLYYGGLNFAQIYYGR